MEFPFGIELLTGHVGGSDLAREGAERASHNLSMKIPFFGEMQTDI
jgi:hypothetical protein